MELGINDISIILGLDFLEQTTIKKLTAIDIKKCYLNTIKLYHPDINKLDDENIINNEFAKIINAAYEQALLKIEDLRKISISFRKVARFNSNKYPDIFKAVISKMKIGNSNSLFLLRSLRAIDCGAVIPDFLTQIGDIFGQEFLSLFIMALESNTDEAKFNKCIKLMQDYILYLDNFKEQVQQLTTLKEIDQTNTIAK